MITRNLVVASLLAFGLTAQAADNQEVSTFDSAQSPASLTLRLTGYTTALEVATPVSNTTDFYVAFDEVSPRSLTLGLIRDLHKWVFVRGGVGYGEATQATFHAGVVYELALGTEWRGTSDMRVGFEWFSTTFLRDRDGLSFWWSPLALRLTFDLKPDP